MRNQTEIYSVPIKGDINHLQSHLENAKSKGAEYYDCISGRISFYKMQSEEEYLEEQEARCRITLEGIKARIKEIRENK